MFCLNSAALAEGEPVLVADGVAKITGGISDPSISQVFMVKLVSSAGVQISSSAVHVCLLLSACIDMHIKCVGMIAIIKGMCAYI